MSASRIRTAIALVALASCVVAAVALAGAFGSSPVLHASGDEDPAPASAHEIERAGVETEVTDATRATASAGADGSTSGTVLAAQGTPPGSAPNVTIDYAPTDPAVGEHVTFDALDPGQSNQTIENFGWDLDGDGEYERRGENVTYAFDAAGDHAVELLVEYVNGTSDTHAVEVSVQSGRSPVARFHYAPPDPLVGETVALNGSRSSDPDGDLTNYRWTVDGDVVANGTNATTALPLADHGNHTVALRVTDDDGNENETTRRIDVQAAPSATFEHGQTEPLVGENVTFDATDSNDADGDVASYEWDLDGDGVTDAYGPTLTHSFADHGVRNVTLTVVDDEDNEDEATRRIDVQAAPNATFDYYPEEPAPGDTVRFDASNATDADGSIANYTWGIHVGSDVFTRHVETFTHQFAADGNWTVELTVRDDEGNVASANRTIPVGQDEPPTAQFDYAPEEPLVGENVTLNASASSDPDGNLTAYDWDVDGDGDFEHHGRNATVGFDEFGEVEVTLQVADDYPNVNETSRTIDVQAAPTARIGYGPEDVVVNGTVTFDALASSDPDGNVTNYWWDLNDDGRYADERGEEVTHSFSTPGNHTVGLRVEDGDDNFGESNVTVYVASDDPPTATFDYEPSDPKVGENVTLNASASSDPDGNVSSYDWDLDGDGIYDVNGASATLAVDDARNYTVALRVTDDDGNVDVRNRTIEATTGQPPTATFAFEPRTPLVGENVTFDATGSQDPEGDVASYEWDFDDGDGFQELNATATHAFQSHGNRTVVLRVTDAAGNAVTTNATVEVGARPTPRFDYEPTEPTAGDVVSFEANASDPDGFVESYSWDFDGDGSPDASGENATYTFETAGEAVVSLNVTDDEGDWEILNRTVSVQEDDAPIPEIDGPQSPPLVGENVTFDGSASEDPDGDVTGYEWTFRSNETTISATGPNVTRSFESAGNYTVTLNVTDDGDNVATTTDSFEVEAAPTAEFDYGPERVVVNGTVTFNASTVSDPDGKVTNYWWYIDGDDRSPDLRGEVVTYNFSTPGNHFVVLRVEDDDDNFGTTNRTLFVETDKHPDPQFEYSPSDPVVNENVTLNAANASDPDGDITEFEWNVDGVGSYDRSGRQITYSFDNPGLQTVLLRVTDDDGNREVLNKTINVTRGPAPEPAFETTPHDPFADEAVTFDASETTDPDGNVEQYAWDFDDDGNPDAFGSRVSHNFTAGSHNVRLRVEDEAGNEASVDRTVNVDVEPHPFFTTSPQSPEPNESITFDASSSIDPDNRITSYHWDFDDGSQGASGVDVNHVFTEGTYLVTLTVEYDGGREATYAQRVSIGPNERPHAVPNANATTTTVGMDVAFDASESFDRDGDIVAYEWDFDDDGDFEARGKTVTHAFEDPGLRTVKLRVTDGDEASHSQPLTIWVDTDQDPTANVSLADRVVVNETATFDASGSEDPDGDVVAYEWDFDGDGVFQPGDQIATYRFDSAGNVTIALRVIDDDGNVDVLNRTVVVDTDQPPVARFDYSPADPDVSDVIKFDAMNASDPDGSVAWYSWDLDDDGENEDDGENVTETYNTAGTHEVTLRVGDDDGNENETTRTIDVSASPGTGGSDDDDDDRDTSSGGGGFGGGLGSIGAGGSVTAPEPSTTVETTPIGSGTVHVVLRNLDAGEPATVTLDDFRAGESTVEELHVTPTASSDRLAFELGPAAGPSDGVPALEEAQAIGYVGVSGGPAGDAIDAVDVRFDVPASAIPEGVSREEVQLYAYADGEWSAVETEGNATGHAASARSLSAMAIGVPGPDLTAGGVTAAPTTLSTGSPVTVTATVRNEGSVAANRSVRLVAANTTLASQPVDLEPGESTSVSFEVSFDNTGTYDLSLAGTDAGSVTVTPDDTRAAGSSGPWIGVALGVLLVLGGIYASSQFGWI